MTPIFLVRILSFHRKYPKTFGTFTNQKYSEICFSVFSNEIQRFRLWNPWNFGLESTMIFQGDKWRLVILLINRLALKHYYEIIPNVESVVISSFNSTVLLSFSMGGSHSFNSDSKYVFVTLFFFVLISLIHLYVLRIMLQQVV